MGRETGSLNPEAANNWRVFGWPFLQLLAMLGGILAGLGTMLYAITAVRQCAVMRTANEQSNSALHVQERAYLTIGPPVLLVWDRIVQIPINNDGKVPSGRIEVVIHEQTLDVESGRAITRGYAWKHKTLGPARPGAATVVLAVPVKSGIPAKILTGRQGMLIAGVITYNDGFADDPSASWSFCVQSHVPTANQIPWTQCDPNLVLPWMEKVDGFPNNEDQP